MYEVAVFSIVTVLCDHRDDLISENSHRAQKQPHTHQQSALGTPTPPWRPPIYFLSIDLSILDSSCQWNLTTRALCVWLLSLTGAFSFAHGAARVGTSFLLTAKRYSML